MSRLPRASGKAVVAALQREGFRVVRVKGSHHCVRHEDGRCTVVPVHGSETIGPGLLVKILKDCGLSAERFEGLL